MVCTATVRSLAPSIWELDDVKKGILCQLFGGTNNQKNTMIKTRGEINVVLVGDPGTAKSQVSTARRCNPIASGHATGFDHVNLRAAPGPSAAELRAQDCAAGYIYLRAGQLSSWSHGLRHEGPGLR